MTREMKSLYQLVFHVSWFTLKRTRAARVIITIGLLRARRPGIRCQTVFAIQH